MYHGSTSAEWLFLQEKATLHDGTQGYDYSGSALTTPLGAAKVAGVGRALLIKLPDHIQNVINHNHKRHGARKRKHSPLQWLNFAYPRRNGILFRLHVAR